MKKIKSLFMLLVVCLAVSGVFKCNLNVKAAENLDFENAEEVEIKELQSWKDFFKYEYECRIENKSENTKLFKICVKDSSYIYSISCATIYDSNKKKIDDQDPGFGLVLEKGDYYVEVKGNSYTPAYKVSMINEFSRITKKENGYEYWDSVVTHFEGWSLNKDGSMKYGEIYTATAELRLMGKYKKFYFTIKVKDKNSDPVIKITDKKLKKLINNSDDKNNNEKVTSKKDKKKPTVKGVKNNKTYKKKVKFKVSDKSGIKKVTLNNKKIKVSKATKGYTVKKRGKYTLRVWDKAGNNRVVKFKIK